MQKRVRGIHGRTEITGVSDFNSWGALDDEMSFIWNNAKTYNEEGSEIYNLADELEVRSVYYTLLCYPYLS